MEERHEEELVGIRARIILKFIGLFSYINDRESWDDIIITCYKQWGG